MHNGPGPPGGLSSTGNIHLKLKVR